MVPTSKQEGPDCNLQGLYSNIPGSRFQPQGVQIPTSMGPDSNLQVSRCENYHGPDSNLLGPDSNIQGSRFQRLGFRFQPPGSRIQVPRIQIPRSRGPEMTTKTTNSRQVRGADSRFQPPGFSFHPSGVQIPTCRGPESNLQGSRC